MRQPHGCDGNLTRPPEAESKPSSIITIAVEAIEQRLDHTRLRQLFAVEPHRLGIGNRSS